MPLRFLVLSLLGHAAVTLVPVVDNGPPTPPRVTSVVEIRLATPAPAFNQPLTSGDRRANTANAIPGAATLSPSQAAQPTVEARSGERSADEQSPPRAAAAPTPVPRTVLHTPAASTLPAPSHLVNQPTPTTRFVLDLHRTAPREELIAAYATAPSTPSSTSAANHVRSHIQALFAARFRYPPLARKHGWQGSVKVRLTLRAGGSVERVQVVESSGHRILDRDALKTLQRIDTVPDVARWLRGQGLSVDVPIRYRLVSG